MSKKHTTLNASIIDTRRPTVAGADRHPGWHALRKIAARITTPLLPTTTFTWQIRCGPRGNCGGAS